MTNVLEDKTAIRELLARYCFAIDTGDVETWLDCFTPEGVFEIPGMMRLAGREELRGFVDTLPRIDGRLALKHFVMNELIDVHGDRATARAYVLVVQGGPSLQVTVAGWYEDRIERHDGRWRFAHRVAHLDFLARS